jgi:Alkylmercury lyase
MDRPDDELFEARSDQQIDVDVRRAIFTTFGSGRVPRRSAVARAVGASLDDVRRSYDRLAAGHEIVLHRDTRDVLIAMPFSAVPSAFRVQSRDLAWWAVGAWDALGIAAATGHDVRITTTFPDCRAPLIPGVAAGRVADASHLLAHFAVPARYWNEDLAFAAATTRLFRSEAHIRRWAELIGLEVGAVVPLPQLWAVAHAWYQDRLAPPFSRPADAALQHVLDSAGLTGDFWRLSP